MITLKETGDATKYELIVDGVSFSEEQALVYPYSFDADQNDRFDDFSIVVLSKEANRQIRSQRFSDIPNNVWNVRLRINDEQVDSDESERPLIMHDLSVVNRYELNRSAVKWSII